jgi:hypothetical protein
LCAALKGRTHGCTDQRCKREKSSCQLGAVHTWHLASFRSAAKIGRYWSNSGHWSAPALNGLVANDPQQTWSNQIRPFSLCALLHTEWQSGQDDGVFIAVCGNSDAALMRDTTVWLP